MNCQPGDMALVIGGMPQNLGKLVTCIEPFADCGVIGTNLGPARVVGASGAAWKLDRPLSYPASHGLMLEAPVALDAFLLPIRPERDDTDREAEREPALSGASA